MATERVRSNLGDAAAAVAEIVAGHAAGEAAAAAGTKQL